MNGFTDIHAHFLFGLDDGARSRSDMEAMLDAAYADGITSLFATPHVTPGVYPINTELMTQRLNEAQAYCRLKGYEMNLHAGAENMYTPALERFAVEGRLLTLGESDHVLVEFVPDIAYRELNDAIEKIERAGYTVVVAHMERYKCLTHRDNALRLKEEHDIRYQMNCHSVLEKTGFLKDRFINRCLDKEIIDAIATDSHDRSKRPTRMKEAFALLSRRYGREYADRITGMKGIL